MTPAVVDLRSDTVTRPTPAMRDAIAAAEVGDDVLGHDPTTLHLEERIAELLGKDRSLFFPSGTMANQTGLAVLSERGTEVVLESQAHILDHEEGAAAVLSGLQLRTVTGEDGLLTAELVKAAIRPPSLHTPRTTMVAVENTHLGSGGRVMPLENLRGIWKVAEEAGVSVHMDGARLWHAAVATGIPMADYAACADTVMVCLSKGLGAPVGSMLAGSADAIERAWRIRRRFGGGMRQSGILAAAGLHALEHHVERLAEDHDRASRLAEGIEGLDGLSVVEPETNIVFIDLVDPGITVGAFLEAISQQGVLMVPFGPTRVRAVTHLEVDDDGVSRAIQAVAKAMETLPA